MPQTPIFDSSHFFSSKGTFNVSDFGALGDGVTHATKAVNLAIESAAEAGGGTVCFPAGTYLCFSIRLKSNVGLFLESGCIILAAKPGLKLGGYDEAEPNEWGDVHEYQDFGHSHWHNSLIWGESLENISIAGPGCIHGHALTRTASTRKGLGNKAIGLKHCRNVVIRDISILMAGHFALLASGVDNLTIENIKVDTIRDGLDLDCCREVSINNCSVNTMNDDAIVLKSSFALGYARDTENVTIMNCQVSGYDPGTFLDGSLQCNQLQAPDRDGPTGRIKLGTESTGGFRNIKITDCVFNRSRGLALESVDGGIIENVTVKNITMDDVSSSPIFIRLGNRASGPKGTNVGAVRNVRISDVVVRNADGRYPAIIGGIPGCPIEDLVLSNIQVEYQGGITKDLVAEQPEELINPFFMRGHEGAMGPRDPLNPPELEAGYPEPSAFGILPAYGLYVRHVKGLVIRNVVVSTLEADDRFPVVLEDVEDCVFDSFGARHGKDQPVFLLKDVRAFETINCHEVKDVKITDTDFQTL